MSKAERLGKILIKAKRACNSSANLRNFDAMR